MNIKLIATDMDGTLLDADRFTVPPRNLAAIRAASARGIQFAIASGRSWSLISATAETIGCVDYGITANGGFLADAAGAPLWERPMPADQCREIIRVLRARNIAFEAYCQGQNYLENWAMAGAASFSTSKDFTDFYISRVHLTDDMAGAVEGRGFEKFHVFRVDPSVRADVLRELASTGPFASASADSDNLELTAPGVHKALALEELCRRLGIAPSEVMAFGDAENDLEMLAWAGESFAMANATDSAKAAAKHLTASNREGGLGQAIERYILNG